MSGRPRLELDLEVQRCFGKKAEGEGKKERKRLSYRHPSLLLP
jgi:hypothetical protein